MAFVSCWKAAFASASTPRSRRRGEFAISYESMSMRTILAAPARRGGMPDHEVHTRPDHDDHVGVPKRCRPRSKIGIRVVFGDDAAALRRRVEWNTRRLYEGLHLGIGLGPQHPRPGDQHGSLTLG